METQTRPQTSLPQGVGRFTPAWRAFTLVAVLVLIAGIAAYIYQLTEGLAVTGLANIGSQGGATWGLYVVMVEYFIGVSLAGIVLVAFGKVFTSRPCGRFPESRFS